MNSAAARAFYERYQRVEADAESVPRAEEPALRRFVSEFGLEGARVLEIGSSRGAFQHLSAGWFGIDLAVESGRHTRRPFAAASAEALPFSDSTFSGAWSIAVLEHVPNPGRALEEIARVLTPGAAAYLAPAWHCRPWAAEGLHVRPFRDLTWSQRCVKLGIPLRETLVYRAALELPRRLLRELMFQARPHRPTNLRYGHLAPNYETFWCADTDACSVLDPHEVLIYFLSRGWSSPSHPRLRDRLLVRHGAILIRKP